MHLNHEDGTYIGLFFKDLFLKKTSTTIPSQLPTSTTLKPLLISSAFEKTRITPSNFSAAKQNDHFNLNDLFTELHKPWITIPLLFMGISLFVLGIFFCKKLTKTRCCKSQVEDDIRSTYQSGNGWILQDLLSKQLEKKKNSRIKNSQSLPCILSESNLCGFKNAPDAASII